MALATPTSERVERPLDPATASARAERHSGRENFTVISWFLPRRLRPHFRALYAYCRTVDDLGDEGSPVGRPAALEAFALELDRLFAGVPEHPVLRALQPTFLEFRLDRAELVKLVMANQMDQGAGRFATFADLRHYCDHSATPVGRLVLELLGARTPEHEALADATCTALQLANFWQDVAVDWRKGRVYLPLEDCERYGVSLDQIGAGVVDDPWRALMRFELSRTRALFAAGAPLADRLRGRIRLDLALFTAGGRAICDAVEAVDYDVFTRRPTLGRRRKAGLALQALAALTVRDPLWWARG